MIDGLDDKGEKDGVKVPHKVVPLQATLFGIEEDGVQLLANVACLVGEGLGEVFGIDAEEAGNVVEDLGVGNVGCKVMLVAVEELEVAEFEDGNDEGEDG